MKNKNRMTIEELRTLELPTILVCDDGFYNSNYKAVTVTVVGRDHVLAIDSDNTEIVLNDNSLSHYPSTKQGPFYEILYEVCNANSNLILCNKDGRTPLMGLRKFSNGCYVLMETCKTGRKFRLNLDTWEIENY